MSNHSVPNCSEIDSAIALYSSGQFLEAISKVERFLRAHPDHPDGLNILAASCLATGRFEQAEACWRHAIEIDPGFADAHFNLGNLYRQINRIEDAQNCYLSAISTNPQHFLAYYNLARMLQATNRLTEAEAAYLKVLEINPDYVEAHNNLAVLLHETHRLQEAISRYRKVLSLKPDHGHALGKVIHLSLQNCQWEQLSTDIHNIKTLLKHNKLHGCIPFETLSIPGLNAAEHKLAGYQYAQSKYVQFLQQAPMVKPDVHYSHDRLRLGYLSADFHDHATVQLIIGILEHHDRSKIETYAYSYGPEKQDEGRARIVAACEHFRDLRTLSPINAAQTIVDDEIDILVDLKGYTQGSRLEITALRPAPVTLSWLGYPGTLGHPKLADYIIGDPVVTPMEKLIEFSETVALMPHCYQPNDNRRKIGNPTTRAENGLPDDKFVFCSFNQTYKISPEVFTVWCRLLEALPDSVLWLLTPPVQSSKENLLKEAALRGIDPSRLFFAQNKPFAEHLARLGLADLALDTFPYTSHTTASDALWAGLPLVTCVGDTFVSRVAASILKSGGLPELITHNFEEYFSLAKDLAESPDKLRSLRQKLSNQRSTTPLFDTALYCQNLESLYYKIWQNRTHTSMFT